MTIPNNIGRGRHIPDRKRTLVEDGDSPGCSRSGEYEVHSDGEALHDLQLGTVEGMTVKRVRGTRVMFAAL